MSLLPAFLPILTWLAFLGCVFFLIAKFPMAKTSSRAEIEAERLKKENKLLRQVWTYTGAIAARRAGEIVKLKLEVEQMTVQMAGISVAAFGGTEDPAVQGQYGWSMPYQDVLELRRRYEKVRALVLPEVVQEIEKLWLGR